jgi:hypothetical protein
MSIFEAKGMFVKETKEDPTEDYLRAYFAESGLDADEQERQLKAALALPQNKTSIKEKKTKRKSSEEGLSLQGPLLPPDVKLKTANTTPKIENNNNNNTNALNSSPKTTFIEKKIALVEEKTSNNTNSSSRSGLQAQIDNCNISISFLGNSIENKGQKEELETRLIKLMTLEQNGHTAAVSDENLNIKFNELLTKASQTEANNNSTTNPVEEKTANNTNNSSSSQIQKEIENFQSFLSILGDSSEDKRQKGQIQAKLTKLEMLHQNSIKSYKDEGELSKTFEELSKKATTNSNTTTNSIEEKVNMMSNGPSQIEQEIESLTLFKDSLGDSSEDKRSKGQIEAQLSKLENAHKAGVKSYANEQELDYYMVQITPTVERLVEPVATKLFKVAKEISKIEQSLALFGDFMSEDGKKLANTQLALLKNTQNLGIETYDQQSTLEMLMTSTPVNINTNNTSPKFSIAQEIAELEGNMDMIEQFASFEEKKEAQAKLEKLKAAQNRGMTTYADEKELG